MKSKPLSIEFKSLKAKDRMICTRSNGTVGIISSVELERVPDPAQRPGPEEKLAANKTSAQYYQHLDL